jgi:hypothetical protein
MSPSFEAPLVHAPNESSEQGANRISGAVPRRNVVQARNRARHGRLRYLPLQ